LESIWKKIRERLGNILKQKIIIGSRGSELCALAGNFVKRELEKKTKMFLLKLNYQNKGDKILDVALSKLAIKVCSRKNWKSNC